MTRVELSEAAAADLEAIFVYGAGEFGEDLAHTYVRGFAEALALISAHPQIGAVHDRVRPRSAAYRTVAIEFTTTYSMI